MMVSVCNKVDSGMFLNWLCLRESSDEGQFFTTFSGGNNTLIVNIPTINSNEVPVPVLMEKFRATTFLLQRAQKYKGLCFRETAT